MKGEHFPSWTKMVRTKINLGLCRMLVSKEDFQHRIKTLIEMQLNRKNSDSAAASTAPSSAFWNAEQLPNAIKKAVNTIASSEEAFELALHYRCGFVGVL